MIALFFVTRGQSDLPTFSLALPVIVKTIGDDLWSSSEACFIAICNARCANIFVPYFFDCKCNPTAITEKSLQMLKCLKYQTT